MEWRRAQSLADDEIVVLFLGRLVLEKGIATFTSVMQRLRERGLPVRALVVGTGPAASLFAALPDAVLTGHLSDKDLARAIASADMLLTPSTTEAFGNVTLEAMASGLPVISADAQNARSMLKDGETGFLCPATDIATYVDRIEALIEDQNLRATMAAAAWQASEAYSWDAASESVAQVYRSLRT